MQQAGPPFADVGSTSLTRDPTLAPCIGSSWSQPLDRQGGPSPCLIAWETGSGRLRGTRGPPANSGRAGLRAQLHPTFLFVAQSEAAGPRAWRFRPTLRSLS